MPELPEVETIVCDLRQAGLEGRVIRDAHIAWPRTAATANPEIFRDQLCGKKISSVIRRAKFIVLSLTQGQVQKNKADLPLSPAWLLVHLRMTGRLDFMAPEVPRDPYERARLMLDDGRTLRFKDIRKFGRWYFYENEPPQFQALGPEPLAKDFTVAILATRLKGRKRQIKPLLLDQTVVSGLGNIYVDEALWEAGIHPLAEAHRLKKDRLERLHQAIVLVLQRGVRNSGTTLGKNELNYYSVGKRSGRNQDELQVFRKTGEPCPRCSSRIVRLIVGQRSSHVCLKCQRKH